MSDKDTLAANPRSTTLEVKLDHATLPTLPGRDVIVDAEMPGHHRLGEIHLDAVRNLARGFVKASGAPETALSELNAPSAGNKELAFAA